jgi:hypothetical protein
VTTRRWILFIAIDLVLLATGLALTLPAGNTTAAALLVVAFVVGPSALAATIVASERATRARTQALEATRPGWSFVPCVTGPTQESFLKAAGEKQTTGVAATLAYGPGGIEIWTGKKSEQKVCGFPWAKVKTVSAAPDVRTWQKRTTTGLRITLTKGAAQDVAVLVKAPDVAALATKVTAARPSV